jgi:hypothetical protein
MGYQIQIGHRQFYGHRGNLHMHTTASDGTVSHRDLARIAAEAGLDFVVVTDHNVFPPSMDGWFGDTLLLVAEEVHDVHREPQSSHTLCFGVREDVAQYAADPQALIDAVVALGGFCLLAHPFERDVADFLPEPNISWRDWQVTGYAGIELWNYMSEFKSVVKNRAFGLLYAYLPALAIFGPYPETLRKWDELLMTRPVSAFGGSDAHGTVYRLGPLARAVQPYDYLFRSVNTHLLTEEPLTGELERDRATIYEVLKTGRGFLGNERLGALQGFSFWARSGDDEATMGEVLTLHKAVELRVVAPASCMLRILRDGRVIAGGTGRELAVMTPQPGVYCAEAYRRFACRRRGWIYSNPIYVHRQHNG